MTNLIFIHGINTQTTGYSNKFFYNILTSYKLKLIEKGLTEKEMLKKAAALVQKEILWADVTIDLTNRYRILQYVLKKKHGWSGIKEIIDPLMVQIMHYVRDKGHNKRGPMNILKRINYSFGTACSNKPDKVIIIAHSLGSVIAFDYVFGFRRYRLNPKINVEMLITLGSPIPLFTASMGHPESKIRLPANVRRWINILDPDDGVARFCRSHFHNIKVEDIDINTGWEPLGAHIKYFDNKKVAALIANRLIEYNI